jgi:hypothetical protein
MVAKGISLTPVPRPIPVDELLLVKTVHRFCGGIIIRITLAPHRADRADITKPLRVADRGILNAPVRMMNELIPDLIPGTPDFSTGPRSKSTTSTWNCSPQRELATNPLSGKLGADHMLLPRAMAGTWAPWCWSPPAGYQWRTGPVCTDMRIVLRFRGRGSPADNEAPDPGGRDDSDDAGCSREVKLRVGGHRRQYQAGHPGVDSGVVAVYRTGTEGPSPARTPHRSSYRRESPLRSAGTQRRAVYWPGLKNICERSRG